MELLSTGQLAKLFDIPKGTIRHYINEELLTPIVNEENGYQQFTEKDVYKLYQIIFLRKIGLSIEEIKETLKKDGILISLKEAKQEIANQILELKKIEETVDHILLANDKKESTEMFFEDKKIRYLKEVPTNLLTENSIDLLTAKELGFSHLELFYFLVSPIGQEKIYVLGTKSDHDKVLKHGTYACKDVEIATENQLENEIESLLADPLFEVSSEKEIICYENIYRSLGYRDKSFFTFEIAL
ncbi:MerR family transcriptional regulator [Vagococcus fluvialis]|uniref:MerR family transcriptional regulator n=1 Tax=Vagococcus fluvialis TaxID=2738 RepID=UPI003B59D308